MVCLLTFVNDYLSISRHFFKFYYNTDIIKGVQKIDIKERILKTAEKMIREGGYLNFNSGGPVCRSESGDPE